MFKRLIQPQSPLMQKVMRNLSWSVVGTSVNMLITLVVGIYVARYLGPEQYGLLNYVVSFAMLFSVFATFSSDEIIVKMLSLKQWPKHVVLSSALFFRLLLALGTVVLVVVCAFLLESDMWTKWAIALYSTSFIAQSFQVFTNFFVAEFKNKFVAKSTVFKGLATAGVKVVLMLMHADLIWFVAAFALDFFFLAFSLFLFFRKNYSYPLSLRFHKKVVHQIWKQSLPLMFTGLAILVYDRVDQVMIKNMLGSTDLGYYALGLRIISVIFFIPKIISQILLPVLVHSYAQNMTAFNKQMQLFSDSMVWITIGLALIFSIFARPLVLLLMGNTYLVTGDLVQLLSWKSLISAFSFVTGQWMIIKGLQRFAPTANIIGAVLNVGLNFLLIPLIGLWGALVATLVSYTFAAYFFFYFVPVLRPAAYLINRSVVRGLPNLFTFGLEKLKASQNHVPPQ